MPIGTADGKYYDDEQSLMMAFDSFKGKPTAEVGSKLTRMPTDELNQEGRYIGSPNPEERGGMEGMSDMGFEETLFPKVENLDIQRRQKIRTEEKRDKQELKELLNEPIELPPPNLRPEFDERINGSGGTKRIT